MAELGGCVAGVRERLERHSDDVVWVTKVSGVGRVFSDAVESFTSDVADRSGQIDVTFNAVGFDVVKGIALTELSRADFVHPIVTWTTTQLLTSSAAARRMTKQRSGVVLLLSSSQARVALASTTGFGVACAAVEGLSRTLAAELGPHGVRVVCIRPRRIADPRFRIRLPRGRHRRVPEADRDLEPARTAHDPGRRCQHSSVLGI